MQTILQVKIIGVEAIDTRLERCANTSLFMEYEFIEYFSLNSPPSSVLKKRYVQCTLYTV